MKSLSDVKFLSLLLNFKNRKSSSINNHDSSRDDHSNVVDRLAVQTTSQLKLQRRKISSVDILSFPFEIHLQFFLLLCSKRSFRISCLTCLTSTPELLNPPTRGSSWQWQAWERGVRKREIKRWKIWLVLKLNLLTRFSKIIFLFGMFFSALSSLSHRMRVEFLEFFMKL